MAHNHTNTPIGVTPTNDPQSVQNKRAQFGKGAVILLAAVGIIAFASYIGFALYAVLYSG